MFPSSDVSIILEPRNWIPSLLLGFLSLWVASCLRSGFAEELISLRLLVKEVITLLKQQSLEKPPTEEISKYSYTRGLLTSMKQLVSKAESIQRDIRLKTCSEETIWSLPLFVTLFPDSAWTMHWYQQEWKTPNQQIARRYVLHMTPPIMMYMFLNVGYRDLWFKQGIKSRSTFYCYYGTELIGQFKRKGSKSNGFRKPSHILQQFMDPSVWLLDREKLAKVCAQEYSLEKYDAAAKILCKQDNCCYFLDFEYADIEREAIAKKERRFDVLMGSLFDTVFKMFIYQVIRRQIRDFYDYPGSLFSKTVCKCESELPIFKKHEVPDL